MNGDEEVASLVNLIAHSWANKFLQEEREGKYRVLYRKMPLRKRIWFYFLRRLK